MFIRRLDSTTSSFIKTKTVGKLSSSLNVVESVTTLFDNDILVNTPYVAGNVASVRSLTDYAERAFVASGNTGTATYRDSAVDADGNIYICGTNSAGSTIKDFAGNHVSSTGSVDVFVAKVSKRGKQLWYKTMGSTNNDSAANVGLFDNKVYVSGTVDTAATPKDFAGAAISGGGSSGVDSDIFVAQLDATTGAQNWIRVCGSASAEANPVTIVDSTGSVCISGRIDTDLSPLDFDGAAVAGAGDLDVFAAKIDAAGAQIYFKTLGTAGADLAPTHTHVDAHGSFYLAGRINGAVAVTDFEGAAASGHNYSNDLYVAKLDAAGTQRWLVFLGNSPGSVPSANTKVHVDDATQAVFVATTTNTTATVVDFAGANPALPVSSSSALVLAKLNSAGAQQWIRIAGSDAGGGDVLETSALRAGQLYISAIVDGSASVTDFGGTVLGTLNSFIDNVVAAVAATSGAQAFFAFAGSAINSKIQVDSLGNVYNFMEVSVTDVPRDFDGNTLTALVAGSISNSALTKLSASGAQQWIKTFGVNGFAYDLVLGSDTDIYVNLSCNDSNNYPIIDAEGTTLGSYDNEDVLLVKFDAVGNQLFAKTCGGDTTNTHNTAHPTNKGTELVWVGTINFATTNITTRSFDGRVVSGKTRGTNMVVAAIAPELVPVGVVTKSGLVQTEVLTNGSVAFANNNVGNFIYFDGVKGTQTDPSKYIVGVPINTNTLVVNVIYDRIEDNF